MSSYRALITGGGRGIGRGIALALAARGFAVVVNALEHDANVEATLADVRALGAEAKAVIGDIADLSGHAAILDAAGPVTTQVNNAGVTVLQRGDLLEATPESFDRCLSVNTRAAF